MWSGLRLTVLHVDAGRAEDVTFPFAGRERHATCHPLRVPCGLAFWTGPADAEERSLLLKLGGVEQRLTAPELLARPDAAEVTVPDDAAYAQARTYRAVPLLSLLPGAPEPFDTLEARALDGFVAQIPLSLLRGAASGGSVAWLAAEPPGQPWPDLPGRNSGPGPFYLVWEGQNGPA